MCALTDFPLVSVQRSHHHPGESTEVPFQPPCRGCSFAAEETGQRCALWGLPASPLVLLGGTAPALFLLGWCSNGGLTPLSFLFSGWRGCWWWLSGMAGLGWRCHCPPLRSLPFALQGKVRNNCVFSWRICFLFPWSCRVEMSVSRQDLRQDLVKIQRFCQYSAQLYRLLLTLWPHSSPLDLIRSQTSHQETCWFISLHEGYGGVRYSRAPFQGP